MGPGTRGQLIHACSAVDEYPSIAGLEQHVLMLSGRLDLTVDGRTHRLEPGDSLRFRLFGPTRFACPGPAAARYIITVIQP